MVIAIIAILVGLLLPALVKAKAQAQRVACLNNMKQLHLGWYLYASDYNDRIAPNWSTGGENGMYPNTPCWAAGLICYETLPAASPWYWQSTNTLLLVPGGFGSIGNYTKNPAIYKCPADKSWILIGGQTHPRVRSVSMNCFMNGVGGTDDACYVFHQTSDIVDPNPSQVFVFADDHEDSIWAGEFIVNMEAVWPDTGWMSLPASRHSGAGSLSFADGHAEIKKWRDRRTVMSVKRLSWWYSGPSLQNRDVLWVQERATSKKPDR